LKQIDIEEIKNENDKLKTSNYHSKNYFNDQIQSLNTDSENTDYFYKVDVDIELGDASILSYRDLKEKESNDSQSSDADPTN